MKVKTEGWDEESYGFGRNRYSTYKKYYNWRVYTHVHMHTDGLNNGLE